MKYIYENGNLIIPPYENFDLALTLDCGQCFRFTEDENGVFSGIVKNKLVRAYNDNGKTVFLNTTEKEFNEIIFDYFDFGTSYQALKTQFSEDETLKKAIDYCGGIRVLKQEPWEALCSFIISQNNNIKRIKGIVERLCEAFGEKTNDGYMFPTAERLSTSEPEDLSFLRAGFRDKYIIDAARKVASGEVSLEAIKEMELPLALEELMKIKGVGLKVASCALLYGFHKTDAFPVDVWMKKVLEKYYKNGFPDEFYENRGIAQQFLFHYIRNEDSGIE